MSKPTKAQNDADDAAVLAVVRRGDCPRFSEIRQRLDWWSVTEGGETSAWRLDRALQRLRRGGLLEHVGGGHWRVTSDGVAVDAAGNTVPTSVDRLVAALRARGILGTDEDLVDMDGALVAVRVARRRGMVEDVESGGGFVRLSLDWWVGELVRREGLPEEVARRIVMLLAGRAGRT